MRIETHNFIEKFSYKKNHSHNQVYRFLSDLEGFYPQFNSWFHLKVLSGIPNGDRKIITKTSGNRIIAVAILKKTDSEKKICTFRVSEEFRNNGLGTELMKESLKWLEYKKPLITVNEENITEFRSFLPKFDFGHPIELEGMYRNGKSEFIFNPSKSFFN